MNNRQAPETQVARDPMVAAIDRVTSFLNQVGDALVALDSVALLAAEADLGGALAELNAQMRVGDRAATRAAGRRAQAALLRCRRLGVSFTSVVRAVNRVGEPAVEYTRTGSQIERALSVSMLVRA